jgi:hypothetical protein
MQRLLGNSPEADSAGLGVRLQFNLYRHQSQLKGSSMNRAARFVTSSTIAALAFFAIPALHADEEKESNPLESLARFVGGGWIGEGRHGPEIDFRTRVVYEWGLNHRLLKAKSYLSRDKGEQLLYESVFTWHPQKKQLFFLSVSAEGGIFEGTMEKKGNVFESHFHSYSGAATSMVRQTIQFLDDDHTLWTVFAKKGNDWVKIIESKQHRETGPAEPKKKLSSVAPAR